MTTLPSRLSLAGQNQTYGVVRTALGDFSDMVREALGTSGLAPVLNNATLLGAIQIGLRTSTPGADLQVFGGLSVTASSAASENPGEGSLLLDKSLKYSQGLGEKILFPVSSGTPLVIGRQTDSLYLRTRPGGSIVAYAGGVHSDTQFAPGIGGVELLRITESAFTYKGQTVYHSGNGVFIRKDVDDSAIGVVTFNAGLNVPSSNITIGTQLTPNTTGKLVWNTTILGSKINFHAGSEDYSIGIQPSTMYLRTGGNFIVYRGGIYNTGNNPTPAPGTGGETLLHLSTDLFHYKGQTVYHSGNSNFVSKTSNSRPGVTLMYFHNIDDPGHVRAEHNSFGDGRSRLITFGGDGNVIETRVDHATNAFNSAYDGRRLSVNESNNRPGPTRLYRSDSDEGSYAQMYWDGNGRYFLEGKGSQGQYIPMRVERSDNSGYADNAGNVNYIHGNAIQDGTVRFHELSRADATASNILRFGVPVYTFGSPITNLPQGCYVSMGNAGVGTGSEQRAWSIFHSSGNQIVGNYYVRWDYITGSGDPHTWVTLDNTGEIIASYDAEDPVDREFPDVCPIYLENGKHDPNAVLIEYPSVEEVITLTEGSRIDKYSLPPWLSKHKHKDKKTPKDLYWAMLKDYAKARHGMHQLADNDMTMWEFVEDLPGDAQKKNWRKQGALKVLSRLAYGTTQPKVHDFLKQHYKVNKKNGKLTLK